MAKLTINSSNSRDVPSINLWPVPKSSSGVSQILYIKKEVASCLEKQDC